jgi:Rap1a immunity proteins
MKRITALIVLALGVSLASPALADDDQTSGNYWLRECKKDPKQLAQSSGSFQYGWCFGVVYGLSMHPLICVPTQVPVVQEMDVVMKYLDAHPETRHKSFRLLALEALKEAFPCADGEKSK